MNLSNRANLIPQSPIRKLAPFAETAKKQGIKVYHLNIGDPDLGPPPAIFEFLHNYAGPVVGYSHSQGEKEFLAGLVDYYHGLGHADLSAENFISTLGGSEAILWAIMTVANPGEEVLTFEPFYTNYHSLAIMAGVKLNAVTTKVEQGFHLPPQEEIIKKITPETKAIIICNPNNPTGTVYTKEELSMIWQITKEHKLFLLSDEVYREFVYDKHRAISFLTIEKEAGGELAQSQLIILDSFSKRYSLCGARVGLACSRNTKIIEAMLKYGQARLSAGSINQLMTAKAIAASQQYLADTVAEYQKRRAAIINGLRNIPGAVFQEPEGAFYIMVKLPVADSEAFAQWLLADFNETGETVMVAPASGFYLTPGLGKDEVRIAYVLNVAALQRAMEILTKAVEKWKTMAVS